MIENSLFKIKENRKVIQKKDSLNKVILTTRSRIARNLGGYRFNSLNTNEEKKRILDTVKDSFFKSAGSKNFSFYNISRLSKLQRLFLLERHILSPEMLNRLYGKGLLFKFSSPDPDDYISILVNEEDHLRIQSTRAGLNIEKTYEDIVKVEKMLEKNLSFAYEGEFGYLTSCPTNIGTALRVSVIAHLPALVLSGKIEDFIKRLIKIKLNIRGLFGEGSDVVGNLFQIANQVSTGKYEKDILDEMNAICYNIIEEEKKAARELKENMPLIVQDSISRAYGMLKYAKMFSFGESLELLSMIELGVETQMLDNIKFFDFYQLISLFGESNIIIGENFISELDIDEIDAIRAGIIRKRILKKPAYKE